MAKFAITYENETIKYELTFRDIGINYVYISKEEAVVLNGRQMTVILNGMLMNICLYSKELIEHILII